MLSAKEIYEKTRFLIKPIPTEILGLKFFPSMEPDISNDQDGPAFGWITNIEVSDCNLEIVRKVVADFGDNLNAIMEIGVNRNGERSMSRILMDDRPKGSFYLGVDIEDKRYLDNPAENTWTLQTTSHDQEKVRAFIANKGIKNIDILFIDGWHSVNTCVNDWLYTDLLSETGVVILHDTNSHPGCVGLFEAVSDSYYKKTRYCTENDFGISVFKRIR
jgi:hypothetical protein